MTYTPGTEADDNSPAVDYIAFKYSPTEAVPSAPVVPTNDIVIGAAVHEHERLRGGGLPRRDGRCDLARPARHLRHRQQARQRRGRRCGRRDHVQPGRRPGRLNAGFRAGPTDLGIPAVFSSFQVGKDLYDAFAAGDAPTVRLETSGENIPRLFPQVVAETRKGDPNHLVLAGAHLDSVPAGPGINDDGSGTAWQLELAEQSPKLHAKPKHKIRFLWFGGEEDGLVGSQYYAKQLTER